MNFLVVFKRLQMITIVIKQLKNDYDLHLAASLHCQLTEGVLLNI